MDVRMTFLNGELDEEIYVTQPEGFVVFGHENKVCRFMKYLYGIKQASKQWHDKFDKTFTSACIVAMRPTIVFITGLVGVRQ
jgi:hypothetical protein